MSSSLCTQRVRVSIYLEIMDGMSEGKCGAYLFLRSAVRPPMTTKSRGPTMPVRATLLGLAGTGNATSHALRPVARFFQRFAGLHEALEAGNNQRPSARDRLDEFGVGPFHLMHDGELDRRALLLQFILKA